MYLISWQVWRLKVSWWMLVRGNRLYCANYSWEITPIWYMSAFKMDSVITRLQQTPPLWIKQQLLLTLSSMQNKLLKWRKTTRSKLPSNCRTWSSWWAMRRSQFTSTSWPQMKRITLLFTSSSQLYLIFLRPARLILVNPVMWISVSYLCFPLCSIMTTMSLILAKQGPVVQGLRGGHISESSIKLSQSSWCLIWNNARSTHETSWPNKLINTTSTILS